MSDKKGFDVFFNEVVNGKGDTSQDAACSSSPMVQKLKQRKERGIVNGYLSWLKTWDEAEDVISSCNNDDNILYGHSLIETLQGKHFTEPVDKNYITVLYEIFYSWSHETKTKYYYVKKTDSMETVMPDGNKYVTYYIDRPEPNGNQIVFLHFNKSENTVIINFGLLIGDEVRLSRAPLVVELKPIGTTKTRGEDTFQLDNLTEAEREDFLKGVSSFDDYSIDVDSTIVIIDTETFQPMPKEVYIEDGEYKAKIKIKTGRSYFAFQVSSEDDADVRLSDFEIAKCYLYGMGDFPKDIIKAAEMFEIIGDAESLYLLAHIWFDESNNDVNSLQDGIFYLEQAAQMGHVAAKAELVYYTMKLLCNFLPDEKKPLIKKYHERIKSAVDTELPGALFLAAYVYEKGLFVERNVDLAFSYYFRAAQATHLAAKARIGLAPVGGFHSEEECRNYFKNSIGIIGLPEYFMGWFLADDPDVMVVTDDILYFYELAANNGITPAIKELAEVYMFGNSYIKEDPAKAIMWYEKLDDIDDTTAVKLANYYLDGKGCMSGSVSDAKAFHLLSETVKKYENGSAYNNLGWMYKIGRGCETPDYMQALSLFEKAAELGCGRAFFHLGDIYENGLGVERNIKIALEFYQKGVELEDKKCIERLNSYSLSESTKTPNNKIVSLLTDIHDKDKEKTAEQIKLLSDMQEQLERMEGHLISLVQFTKNDLQTWIAEQRPRVDDEVLIEQFAHRTAEYINMHVQTSNQKVQEEEQHLQNIFGSTWDRLLPVTQSSLVSASVLWNLCANISEKSFDYSGIIIAATSALESELKRVFYTGFRDYLLSTFGDPENIPVDKVYTLWPEKYLSLSKKEYDEQISKGNYPKVELARDEFRMGSLPYMFNDKNEGQKKLLRNRMKEYLVSIFKEEYCKNPLLTVNRTFWKNGKEVSDPNSFISQCEYIRTHYRNPAGHVEVLSRKSAEECYAKIVGANKVDAFRFTYEVEGLIMMLYEYIK